MSELRPVPDDFAIVAPTKTRNGLKEYYCTNTQVVDRWLHETGAAFIGEKLSRQARPVPSDFAEKAKVFTRHEMSVHYECSEKTIDLWREKTGIEPVRAMNAMRRARQPKAYVPKSLIDLAADTIRRKGFVVYRANENGSANQRARFWRVGWSILTDCELLERAAKYDTRDAEKRRAA